MQQWNSNNVPENLEGQCSFPHHVLKEWTLGWWLKTFFYQFQNACSGIRWTFWYVSRIQKHFFENFDKSFPTNAIFCPHFPQFWIFDFCALLKDATGLQTSWKDVHRNYTLFEENLVGFEAWSQTLQTIKCKNIELWPVAEKMQNALMYEIVGKFV